MFSFFPALMFLHLHSSGVSQFGQKSMAQMMTPLVKTICTPSRVSSARRRGARCPGWRLLSDKYTQMMKSSPGLWWKNLDVTVWPMFLWSVFFVEHLKFTTCFPLIEQRWECLCVFLEVKRLVSPLMTPSFGEAEEKGEGVTVQVICHRLSKLWGPCWHYKYLIIVHLEESGSTRSSLPALTSCRAWCAVRRSGTRMSVHVCAAGAAQPAHWRLWAWKIGTHSELRTLFNHTRRRLTALVDPSWCNRVQTYFLGLNLSKLFSPHSH